MNSPHIISILAVFFCFYEKILNWNFTQHQISYPLTFFPLQQLAEWPFWLLFQSFSRLNKPTYAGLAHFHWAVLAEGSSAGGDSCVCNLKHSLPCIPPLSLHPIPRVRGGAVRGRPAVLYRSHTCTGREADQSASLSDLKKIICYCSLFVSWGAQPATGILGLPTQYFTVQKSSQTASFLAVFIYFGSQINNRTAGEIHVHF